MPGVVVDGNDLLAVHRAVLEAAQRARRGEGPSLLEFKTFRMRGHEEASGTDYVPKALARGVGAKGPGRALRGVPGGARGPRARRSSTPSAPTTRRRSTRSSRRPCRLPSRARASRRRSPTSSPRASWSPAPRTRASGTGPGRCGTSTPSPTACASPCGATSGWCCWDRTSRSTVASSRSPAASSRSSGRPGCGTRPSSSPAPSGPPWGWPWAATCPWWRCSSGTSSPAASTRSSTTSPRPTGAGGSASRWCSGCRWAGAWAPGPSTRRTWSPGSPRWRG